VTRVDIAKQNRTSRKKKQRVPKGARVSRGNRERERVPSGGRGGVGDYYPEGKQRTSPKDRNANMGSKNDANSRELQTTKELP